jgi:hypothetical protein
VISGGADRRGQRGYENAVGKACAQPESAAADAANQLALFGQYAHASTFQQAQLAQTPIIPAASGIDGANFMLDAEFSFCQRTEVFCLNHPANPKPPGGLSTRFRPISAVISAETTTQAD